MMARLKQSGLVWSLLLCLVLVNGFLTAPAVAHADHHAKHQAGTHSTGLCAWQCAAGQDSDTSATFHASMVVLVAFIVLVPMRRWESRFSARVSLRGPPASLR